MLTLRRPRRRARSPWRRAQDAATGVLLLLAVAMAVTGLVLPASPVAASSGRGPTSDWTMTWGGGPGPLGALRADQRSARTAPAAPVGSGPVDPDAPMRLVIPSLSIDAPIVPITLAANGVLEPPSDYRTVGRWDGSALPGADTGQTVITGHSVHYGGGALDSLPTLRHGEVDVVTPDRTVRYEVAKAIVASHAELARYSQTIFGQQHTSSNGARLVLVTCTDYDGTEWENNFVLLARRID